MAVVIPTYGNASTIASVVNEVLEGYCWNVIVVNDGSTDSTAEILASFKDKITVLTHPVNWGKGAALRNGLQKALEQGWRYAICLDADGQHFPSDIPAFLDAIEQSPDSLIVGVRNLTADGMPRKNTFANRFSNFWYRLFTGHKLADTQSGFRLYPLLAMNLEDPRFTDKYEFELEAIVFASWNHIRVEGIPVHVKYLPQKERVSHFRPFRDFMRISLFNTCVLFYCFFWRWPYKFFRALNHRRIKMFIDKHIVHAPDTNFELSLAVGLGVFIGILPIWGFQMVVAYFLASATRLNKIAMLTASNISIAPLAPFIIFASYWTGCQVMGTPLIFSPDDFTAQDAGQALVQYLIGAGVLAVAAGLSFGLLTWLVLSLCGRKVSDRYKK